MRILITGGAGYIGSHAVRLLLSRGHDVWVYDNLSHGHRAAAPADRLIVADLADIHRLDQTLLEHRIEAVVHFAAFAFVDREKSYASRVGRPENVGVIGLVAIEELAWRPRPLLAKKDRVAPERARALGTVGGIGTDYGRDLDSRVYYVPFVRSTNKRTVTLYYDTAEALRRAGVPVSPPLPVAFPGDTEFVPPPPGS